MAGSISSQVSTTRTGTSEPISKQGLNEVFSRRPRLAIELFLTDFRGYWQAIIIRVSVGTLTLHDVDDIIMDVILVLAKLVFDLENGGKVDRPRDFVAYAGSIVRNKTYDFLNS